MYFKMQRLGKTKQRIQVQTSYTESSRSDSSTGIQTVAGLLGWQPKHHSCTAAVKVVFLNKAKFDLPSIYTVI